MTTQGDLILWIVVGAFAAICLAIICLMAWKARSRTARSNQTAAKAAPQSTGELIWTMAPMLVFALVVAPLLGVLYMQNTRPAADLTITVTGRMWSWNYQYSNYGNFSFGAPMLARSAASLSDRSGPETYDHILVPVAKAVRIIAVGANVVYSWAIPSLGARIQALPGWTNQSWFKAANEGRYFGQCSELCGLPHAFKPFEIEVVSQARFDRWVADWRARRAPSAAPLTQQAQAQTRAGTAR